MAKTDAYTGRTSAVMEDTRADEFYRPAPAPRPRPERVTVQPTDDAEDEPFLRTRRRVPVRKGFLPAWAKTRWGRIAVGIASLCVLAGIVAVVYAVRNFLDHDPRFRIESSGSIQTTGNSQLTRAELLSVFGSDIGRNIFFVPLAVRRNELEEIPWVERATVMRLLPDELRVAVTERTPIAFVRLGSRINLVDANGVILQMPPAMIAARGYSFPVVTGISPDDPLSTRGARMHLYRKFITAIDSTGEKVSEQLSEVDLSDPEDVRVTVPARGNDLLLHFGQEDFLNRWHNYQAHIVQWQQQYPHLASVDLRYQREVVLKMASSTDVDPEMSGPPGQVPAGTTNKSTAAAAHPAHVTAHTAKHHATRGKR